MRRFLVMLLVACGATVLAPGSGRAITLHQAGYVADTLVAVPVTTFAPSDVELDAAGNLYVPTQPDGIRRITPQGAMSLWSTAPALELTFASDGSGYGAGGSSCNCIVSIGADGSSSTLHQDSYAWRYVELGPDGALYAVLGVGAGEGIYRVDRATGDLTPLALGGPGPGGDGLYFDLAFGADGKLYVIADDMLGAGPGLFRFENATFTRVASLPHGGFGLTCDPSGIFYTAVCSDSYGEVWSVDPVAGTSALLASGLDWPAGLGYDPVSKKLYVVEQGGRRLVWFIMKDPAPARPTSWSRLKSIYR